MIVVGVLLLVGGIFATGFGGAMPGGSDLGPPPRGRRLVFIFFGAVMVIWGIVQLVRS